MSIKNKVAVITGAGGGLGQSFAKLLSQEGVLTILCGRTLASLEETATMCLPGSTILIVGDVTNRGDMEKLFSQAYQTAGRIDILINCAGLQHPGFWLEQTAEEWCEVVRVNLFGVELCCRLAIPYMRKNGYGRIINIGSRTAMEAPVGLSAYATSKAGLFALTRMLGLETEADTNILINDLIPGVTMSQMSSFGQNPDDVYPYLRELINLPDGGKSGKSFYKGQIVDLWKREETTFIRKLLRRLSKYIKRN
ncbi:MAG: SDR family NAD(P)-dependent oxidoreductase [bacterium]